MHSTKRAQQVVTHDKAPAVRRGFFVQLIQNLGKVVFIQLLASASEANSE
jgi:hypothetical protein